MKTKKVICSKCGLSMQYWTKNNYIHCTKCNEAIAVEPMLAVTLADLVMKGVIFVGENWVEEDGQCWWPYYKDKNRTIEIEDIDEFVRDYNEVGSDGN